MAIRLLYFVLLIQFVTLAAAQGWSLADDNISNPQPLSDDLILPMPGGRSMVFRPVCIGEGSGSYAWKRFRVGDPSGGYKESPTGVALGGAFRVEKGSDEDWCYYIGKYEVSEDQLSAFAPSSPEFEDSRYPARDLSWFDAADFIRKYNEWLYANGQQDIPDYGGVPGYLRLPTEFEWEFAARGGSEVDSGRFDRKTPYPARKLAEYEWFAGPKSSHNKVKKTGVLKPNVLGIHDMLGNVAEMTRTLYQIEYYQGRSGGFVAKGGHFLTDSKQLRSSLRTEQEFYAFDPRSKKVLPRKKTTLGFRLVLSSLVFPNRQVSSQLKEDWDVYHQGLAQSLPAVVSTSATSARTQVSGTDAAGHLKRLQSELARSGAIPENVQQELDLLAASLDDIQFIITQAEKDSAYAWIKIGSEQAFFVHKESRKLPILDKLLETAKSSQRTEVIKKYQARQDEITRNIDQAMSSYTESIRQLGTTSSMAIAAGFDRYGQFLKKREADQQLKLLDTVRRHADHYIQVKRTDDEKWKTELVEWDSTAK